MLKPTSLLTHGFNTNKKAHEKLFNHMCNFGARSEWKNERRFVSSYLDVKIRNDKYRLVNPNPLDCVLGYIMEDSIGDRALKRLLWERLNIIDGSISSYCYIINPPKNLHMIKQENELASVLCDIESGCLGGK